MRLGVKLRAGLFLAGVALMAAPGTTGAAGPKPRSCFSPAEEVAELDVRQGIRLREGAAGCTARPFQMPLQPIWDEIDKNYGPLFANQTRIRHAAFVREFADNADNKEGEWNGRIVTYFRNYPLTDQYCTSIQKQLQAVQKGGWGAFTKQAAKSGDVVRMIYKSCPPGA